MPVMIFIEFSVIDVDTMDFRETILIYAPLILEVSIGGSDIARIVAEVSSQISIHEKLGQKKSHNFCDLNNNLGRRFWDSLYMHDMSSM